MHFTVLIVQNALAALFYPPSSPGGEGILAAASAEIPLHSAGIPMHFAGVPLHPGGILLGRASLH